MTAWHGSDSFQHNDSICPGLTLDTGKWLDGEMCIDLKYEDDDKRKRSQVFLEV